MVILREIIIGAFLCIAISKLPGTTQCPPSPSTTEDLQDEYYTVIPTVTDQFVPQDEKDAEAIFESNNRTITIAGILPYREKVRRYAISLKMDTYYKDPNKHWMPENYAVPQKAFDDLCFALTVKEATDLGNYMKYFMEFKFNELMGIAMALTKDTHDLVTTFDSHFSIKFDDFREKYLEDPYKILVKNWTKQNREPLEKDDLNHDSVTKDANALNKEHDNGGWKKNRTELECILFQKSIKYARAVMEEFEKLNNGKSIEDIISSDGLDKGLASTYSTFARYIKNKPKFIAEILSQYSKGNDYWMFWDMCMAVIHPQEWPTINQAFKQSNKSMSLTAFITAKNDDKVTAEMMAVIIDPSFKPTQFQPAPGQSLYPSSVPPTVPAHC